MNGSPEISGSDIWCNTPDAVTGGYDDEGDNCINTDCTSCEEDDCLGDITKNGTVDGEDLGILVANWGTSDPDADLNDDGGVDGADLGQLFASWGPCS